MVVLPPAAVQHLSQHCGLISTHDLARCGVTDWERRQLLRAHVLEPVGLSTYRLSGMPASLVERATSTVLRHPAGYVTGPTAARLDGLRNVPADERVHLMLPRGAAVRKEPGIVVRQSVSIEAGRDYRLLGSGLRIATASRLAFDLAALVSVDRLAYIVEDMVFRHWTTRAQLAAIARAVGGRGVKGSTRFAEVVLDRMPGGAHESNGEVRLGTALRNRGIPLESQVRLLDIPDGGNPVRVDLAVPHLRWGIEIDLHPRHFWGNGSAHDARRDRRCQLIDWQVSRVGRLDMADFDNLVDELWRLYLARIQALTTR